MALVSKRGWVLATTVFHSSCKFKLRPCNLNSLGTKGSCSCRLNSWPIFYSSSIISLVKPGLVDFISVLCGWTVLLFSSHLRVWKFADFEDATPEVLSRLKGPLCVFGCLRSLIASATKHTLTFSRRKFLICFCLFVLLEADLKKL